MGRRPKAPDSGDPVDVARPQQADFTWLASRQPLEPHHGLDRSSEERQRRFHDRIFHRPSGHRFAGRAAPLPQAGDRHQRLMDRHMAPLSTTPQIEPRAQEKPRAQGGPFRRPSSVGPGARSTFANSQASRTCPGSGRGRPRGRRPGAWACSADKPVETIVEKSWGGQKSLKVVPSTTRFRELCRTAERRQASQLRIRQTVRESRGDKTAIELFIAGIKGWEAGLRRRIGL